MTEYPYPSAEPQTVSIDFPAAYPADYPAGANHLAGENGLASEIGSDSPSVKDKATDSANVAKQAAADVTQTATDKAKDVAHETKKQARDLVDEARGQLSDQAAAQHESLVKNLRSLADELMTMVDRGENSGVASNLVSQAGDRAAGAADWLDKREPGDLLGEVRSFARQRPGTFILGAVVAGVVVGRLTRGVVAVNSDEDAPNASEYSAPREYEAGSVVVAP